MAIVDFLNFNYPPLTARVPPISYANLTMNVAGDKEAFIIQVPKSGTLDYFEWRTGSVGNNPDNGLRLSFQGVSVTTGLPDGVVGQFVDMTGTFAANTWQTPASVMTDTGLSGGVKRVVTKGDWIACCIDFVNFVTLDSIGIARSPIDASYWLNNITGYIADGSTGTYAKLGSAAPVMALKYDDGSYGLIPGVIPAANANTRAFNTGTTPDERAVRFKVPVTCRVTGCWVWMATTVNLDVKLLDNSDSVLASVSIDKDIYLGSSVPFLQYVLFPNEVTLTAGSVYRLSFLPTTVTSISLYDFDVATNAILSGLEGGVEMFESTRTDAGAWTDINTTRLMAGLIINGIDVSAGGGGGEHSSVF